MRAAWVSVSVIACGVPTTAVLLDRPRNEFHDDLADWQLRMDAALARPGPLSSGEIRAYFEDGFVHVASVLDAAFVEMLRADVDQKQMDFASSLLAEGKLSGTEAKWAEVPWDEKLLRMQEEYADASVLFAKNGKLTPAFQKLYTHEKVVAIAKQLGVPAAGDDGRLAIHPAWNLRGKMPMHGETEVPWHQDNSYWEPRLWSQQIFTAWVPLVDATPANGCMEYVRGSHKKGQTVTHTCCLGNTWYTETSLDDVAAQLGLPGTSVWQEASPTRALFRSLRRSCRRTRFSFSFRDRRRRPTCGSQEPCASPSSL